MTNYILIDAKTRAPVPLPWYGKLASNVDVSIHDFRNFPNTGPMCAGHINGSRHLSWFKPGPAGLALITEEQFMAEREGHFPLCSCPECCENG